MLDESVTSRMGLGFPQRCAEFSIKALIGIEHDMILEVRGRIVLTAGKGPNNWLERNDPMVHAFIPVPFLLPLGSLRHFATLHLQVCGTPTVETGPLPPPF